MFSIQPDNAVASYTPARQKPTRGDQPSGSDDFGALVDTNAGAADTDGPRGDQSDPRVRRKDPDDRQAKTADVADTRTAKQDNADRDTRPASGQTQSKPGGKDAAEKPDASKTTAGDKSGGKNKTAPDSKDDTDSVAADQTAATAANATVPASPAAAIVIAATAPAAATGEAGEETASAAAGVAAGAASATAKAAHIAAPDVSADTKDTKATDASIAPASPKADPQASQGSAPTDKPGQLTSPTADPQASQGTDKAEAQPGKAATEAAKSGSSAPDAKQAATPMPPEHRAAAATDVGVLPVQTPPQNMPVQTQNFTVTPAHINTTLASTPVPISGLAVDIALKAAGGNSRFEIRLDPAELGRIDVRLDVDKHGQVTSHLTVERPATLDMLRKDAPQLQQALEDAGLKTGNGGLQFSLRDQSSFSGRQDDGQSGRHSHRLVITEDTSVPAQIAGQTYGRALGSRSGVDISI